MSQFNRLPFRLFVMCVVFVFGTVIAVFHFSYGLLEQEVRSNSNLIIQHLQAKADQNISLMHSSMESMLYVAEAAYMSNGHNPEELQKFLKKLFEVNMGLIQDIYIIQSDTSIIGGSNISAAYDGAEEWRQPILDRINKDRRTIFVSDPYFSRYNGWTVTMAKYIPGTEPLIAAAVDIDLKSLEYVLYDINQGTTVVTTIVDSKGRLISGNTAAIGASISSNPHDPAFRMGAVTSQELVDESGNHMQLKVDGPNGAQEWVMTKSSSTRYNWSILTFTNDSFLQRSFERFQHIRFTFLTVGLLASLLIAFLITRYIRNPLHQLMLKMRLIRQGHLDIPVVLDRKDEFGDLSRSFDLMLARIRELLRNVEQEKELKRLLELQVLQSQINPHFLYNTLGAISNMVTLGKTDRVDAVIQALIHILEYGIADVSERVPLRDELDNVRNYLFVQNARYNSSYELETEVEEELWDYPVFRMSLQPLVENSLFHGYKGGRLPGLIRISAYRTKDRVLVDVRDYGAGMTDELRRTVLEPSAVLLNSGKRRRIGLSNIHQRIALYYGSSYGLELPAVSGPGTIVRASFPILLKGEAAYDPALFDCR